MKTHPIDTCTMIQQYLFVANDHQQEILQAFEEELPKMLQKQTQNQDVNVLRTALTSLGNLACSPWKVALALSTLPEHLFNIIEESNDIGQKCEAQ